MKILKKVNLVLLVLLSITSGTAKVMQMPQEVKFFGDAGFSDTSIILFGVMHLVGGILLVLQNTRKLGAVTMVVTFGISTIIIFTSGKLAFGFFSILPILMAGIIIKEKNTQQIG